MTQDTGCAFKDLLRTAENLLYKDTGSVEDWERDLLVCLLLKMSREEIEIYVKHFRSEQPYYAISNLFGHKVSELMRKISEALGELITGSRFIEPLRRQHQRNTQANLTITERFINYLVYAKESIDFTDLEIEVLRGILEGKTYGEIANNTIRSCRNNEVCNSIWKCRCKYSEDCIRGEVGSGLLKKVWECRCSYSEDYIRGEVGRGLLKKVTAIMGVEVNKRNCIKVFETWQQDARLVMSDCGLAFAGKQR